MNYTLIGFIVYLVLVLMVGFITYRINKSHSDFFLAGRKLNPWVVAFSERASGESAWLLLGLPGAALAVGFLATWAAVGCVLGIIFYWLVIAKDLRNESERVNAITLPNFFAEKLGDGKKIIRFVATLIIVFFFTFYLAAQFNGAGKVLDVTFGIPVFWGIVLGAVVIIFYTMMGGFFAVAWTDF
ncbi:MAG: sodium/proline symporter, partial [Bacteroidetes bacterium]|nr:sodium/proline symporter [Bacteroidota bacterium]